MACGTRAERRRSVLERWEILKEGGYRLLSESASPLGTDAFLLSAFPRLRAGLRVCDLCGGAGTVGLLLLQRCPDLSVTAVELREEAVRLAERSAAANGLEDRLAVRQGDLREIRRLLPAGSFDLVTCDPPYFRPDSGALPADPGRRAARAETGCTPQDICGAAAWLLRWGGSFCLVHRPERLTDLLGALRAAGLEPKRLRTVHKTAEAAPSLLLLEGRRGGRPGLRWQEPLILAGPDGGPTEELDRIYFRREGDAP